MNRRNFIGSAISALAGFSILPPASTYTRLWKAVRVEPDVILQEVFLPRDFYGTWKFTMESFNPVLNPVPKLLFDADYEIVVTQS